MTNTKPLLCILVLMMALFVSCTTTDRRYKIGVSQCSEDIWREKQNAELRMGAYLHDNVELAFAAAYDSDERQVQQIDSLVNAGIDLLIVAPNQVATISPAIDRAYDKGIPVIVFERKTNSKKYTAFMSADNYEMGRVMGEYIAQRIGGKGNVMEVMGLKGSSPAIERHKGFADAISKFPDIKVIATLQGDWTEESAYQATKQWLSQHPSPTTDHPIDYVFGQNDRMALGARRALSVNTKQSTVNTKYCGIDGLPGEDGGIKLVCDSILDATYIYPTHGDKLLQLALDILDGKAYNKENSLMSALVTKDNAHVLLMQDEEITRKTGYIDNLHNIADEYLSKLDVQRTVLILAIGVILLLILAIVFFYLYHQGKISLRRQRVVDTLWNMEKETTQSSLHTPHSSLHEKEATPSLPHSTLHENSTSLFISRFKDVIEARLADSELSVEDLAADMNLSRVQLYRKVKNITNSSPVELLRMARLNRAYQLLLTTDKSVSEVAYEVGFSAPSYFAKCFKDAYGMPPGDIRN